MSLVDVMGAGELGLLDGSGGRLADRYDPRSSYKAGEGADHETIGEDERGIWTTVHPDALLLEARDLWDIVTIWQSGVRQFSKTDVDAMTAYELNAFAILSGAETRRLYPKKDPRPEDAGH